MLGMHRSGFGLSKILLHHGSTGKIKKQLAGRYEEELHPAGVLLISLCILQEFRPAGAERQQYELPVQLIKLFLMDGFCTQPRQGVILLRKGNEAI